MTPEELQIHFGTRTNQEIIQSELLERVPWIFESSEPFHAWRNQVSTELNMSATSILIVGSAATGFSLSPHKPGRAFRRPNDPSGRPSDIDVALVDAALFTDAWNAVVRYDRTWQRLGTDEEEEKLRRDVYWGAISAKAVPRNTDPARTLLRLAAASGASASLRGYPVRSRVYRRFEDLREYHLQSIRTLRRTLRLGGNANG
jgi:hypothetical protein